MYKLSPALSAFVFAISLGGAAVAQDHGGGHGGGHHGHCDANAEPSPLLSVGDVNGDQKVCGQDVAEVAGRVRNPDLYHPLYDRNADGAIDNRDVVATARDVGASVPMLDTQVARIALATMRYAGGPQGLQNAMQDGFLPFTTDVKGHGVHYVKITSLGVPEPDLYAPRGLNFDTDGNLIAVFYYRSVARSQTPNPADPLWFLRPDPAHDHPPHVFFDGRPHSDWHTHLNFCIEGLGQPDWRDVCFRQGLNDAQVAECVLDPATGQPRQFFPATDRLFNPKIYMLHAWVHTLNPCGLFAGTHPEISPEAPEEHELTHCDGQPGHDHGH
jgi:hypothetical protein